MERCSPLRPKTHQIAIPSQLPQVKAHPEPPLPGVQPWCWSRSSKAHLCAAHLEKCWYSTAGRLGNSTAVHGCSDHHPSPEVPLLTPVCRLTAKEELTRPSTVQAAAASHHTWGCHRPAPRAQGTVRDLRVSGGHPWLAQTGQTVGWELG